MKTTLALLGLTLLLSACKNDSHTLDELKDQNKRLVEKIDVLEQQIEEFNQEDIRFIPFATLDKHNVSIGEELNLQVNIARWYDKDYPTVVLKDQITGAYNDTLDVGEYNSHMKSIVANKSGEHLIEGKVLFSVNGQPKEELFQTRYVVE